MGPRPRGKIGALNDVIKKLEITIESFHSLWGPSQVRGRGAISLDVITVTIPICINFSDLIMTNCYCYSCSFFLFNFLGIPKELLLFW